MKKVADLPWTTLTLHRKHILSLTQEFVVATVSLQIHIFFSSHLLRDWVVSDILLELTFFYISLSQWILAMKYTVLLCISCFNNNLTCVFQATSSVTTVWACCSMISHVWSCTLMETVCSTSTRRRLNPTSACALTPLPSTRRSGLYTSSLRFFILISQGYLVCLWHEGGDAVNHLMPLHSPHYCPDSHVCSLVPCRLLCWNTSATTWVSICWRPVRTWHGGKEMSWRGCLISPSGSEQRAPSSCTSPTAQFRSTSSRWDTHYISSHQSLLVFSY